MRIIRNERRIRLLMTVGRYVPWVALLVLAAGLIISYVRPEWLLLMVGAVIVGVVLSIVGGRYADRYAGPLAHHSAIAAALKGLDRQHVLIQYILPAPHVLFDPGGATVLVVKSHAGDVIFQDGRFKNRQRGRIFRQLAGQESISLAHEQAAALTTKVGSWLDDELGESVPVRAAIVFVNPRAQVDAADSPIPTFYGKKIKNWLRGPGKRKGLPAETYNRVLEVLETWGEQVES